MLKIIVPQVYQVVSSNIIGGSIENQQAFADGIVGSVSTATSEDGSIDLTISGVGEALALLQIGASSLSVNNNTIDIEKPIMNWKDWFFSPRKNIKNIVIEDAAINSENRILLTVNASLGMLIYGNVIEVGDMQYGVNSELLDYSTKKTDDQGYTTLVKRGFGYSFSATIELGLTESVYMTQELEELRATPLVFFDKAANLITFGFFKSIKKQIVRANYALLSIEVEGMQ